MVEFEVVTVLVLVAAVAFEYRFRKPDFIILREKNRGYAVRKSLLYPRHFSLLIRRSTHAFQFTVEATTKGNLQATVKVAATVAASLAHLDALIRVGGWNADATEKSAHELEGQLQAAVKAVVEKFAVEELSSQKLLDHLAAVAKEKAPALGLEIISVNVLSFDPANPQISEALRQQEEARILEQTETLKQQARIAASRSTLKADEEIALLEHGLELKKYEMQKSRLERESAMADVRVEDELRRNRKRLAFDKEELELLKKNPELLMLTPQAARLAEASQTLKNARTIVSLSPQDMAQGSDLVGLLQRFLQEALDTKTGAKRSDKSK